MIDDSFPLLFILLSIRFALITVIFNSYNTHRHSFWYWGAGKHVEKS